jgi:hypothetical protein
MRREELRWPRRHPLGHAFVVVSCRLDLPAQDKEHHVEDGHLLGQSGDVWEVTEDVDDDLRQGVSGFFGVEQRGDAGICGANKFAAGDAFGGFTLARLGEVEEDAVERAGRGNVAAWCCPGRYRLV